MRKATCGSAESKDETVDHSAIEETRHWIAAKMSVAKIELLPFPHLIISEFFPAEVYAKILRLNPFNTVQGTDWITRQHAVSLNSPTPYWLRKQIKLPNQITKDWNPEQARFWTMISDVFQRDGWFFEQIRTKCAGYLALRFGPLIQDPDFRAHFNFEQFLQRHEANYSLGPHTDIPTRVATCIFSFADQAGYEEFGTQICIPRDRYVRCSGRGHHPTPDFEVVKLAPYRPNNFFLFLKTLNSFHSVPTLNREVPNGRFGMQVQIYERGVGIFRDITAVTNKNENPIFQEKSR